MFEQATLSAVPVSRRLWSTGVGVTGQALMVGALILAPMVFPQVLPQVDSIITLIAPGPPPAAPAPGVTVRPHRMAAATRVYRCDLCAPVVVPSHVTIAVDEPPETVEIGVPGGVPGGSKDGIAGGILDSIIHSVAPPALPKPVEAAPPKPAAPAPIRRYRIGGLVRPATLIRRVEPQYPPLAKQARVQGVVELEGVIGIDGRVHELRVISGHPLLVKAAWDAVSQWLYAPTTLNSQPIEVIMPVTVTFRLQ